MRGKYSPTVDAAYRKDQNWFKKYSDYETRPVAWFFYDPEGFDQYGYDENGIDRAGNQENAYYADDEGSVFGDSNSKYDCALYVWGFDGVKPVRK